MADRDNALHLSFEDRRAYTFDRIVSGLHQIRLTFIVFIFLYGLFAIFDFLLVGEYLSTFLFIRFGIVIPLMIVCVALTFHPSFHTFAQPFMVLCWIVGSTGIAYMLIIYPGNFSYYGGIFMVIQAGFFLLKLDTPHAVFAGLLSLLLYVAGYVYHNGQLNPETLMTIVFFLGANLIGALGNYQMDKIGQANFMQKREIQRQNEQLQDRVREQRTELLQIEKAIDSTSDAVVIFNPEGVATYRNAAYRLLMRPFSFPGNKMPHFLEDILAKVLTGRPWKGERTVSDEMGVTKVLLIQADAVHNEQGIIAGIVTSCRDITEHKENEKELLKNEKLGSLGILAGGIAHDFNNILTGIIGNISFAKVFLDTTHKSYKLLAEAEKASQRAGELAHQLLTFSRGGEPVKKVVSPQHLINEAISLVLRGSNVKAVVDIHNSIHAIEADEGQMSQVFHNIIINATQAMPGGGTLMVTARNEMIAENNTLSLPPGRYIRVVFADQGCGIPDDHLKKIFDPYFTTKSAGNGLGLASVHSIIKRHGGHIGVSSMVGKGTTFTIFLPSLGERYAKFQADIATQAKGRHKGGSILVMDDEEMIRDIAASMLTHLGYEVTTCAAGDEAVELYKKSMESGHPFLTVIMDLTIPGGLGGKQAASQIHTLFPNARLIVSSGYSNDPIMSNYQEYGFSGAIAKPYNVDEVEQVLSSLFE
ncbi:ATP-binding protein [Desulforhopalus sp. IMCC35007]|uniref:hybrid sensor histidine kinase/response regulator n=1 Tax=Desulforhopalus sp. IMCC35007 TaxID=2569543 RepID=UPI00145F3A87|nr:ATP-binding protein [Desulforhopalus sp. IMCC35007]